MFSFEHTSILPKYKVYLMRTAELVIVANGFPRSLKHQSCVSIVFKKAMLYISGERTTYTTV